jgi:hypothetical protein
MIVFGEVERVGKEVVMSHFKVLSCHSREETEVNHENKKIEVPSKI